MLSTPIGRLRVISIVEGLSYLVLLGIAMPLKYLAGQPELVRFVGSLHGLLAILFVLAVVQVWFVRQWSLIKVLVALIASVIPFGAFFLEASLRREAYSDLAPTAGIDTGTA